MAHLAGLGPFNRMQPFAECGFDLIEPGKDMLILIRHSLPAIDPALPARQWQLSEEGRQRCELLGARLEPFGLARLITSTEPKAIQTGEILAQRLAIPCGVAEGLHEHLRECLPWMDRDQFLESAVTFFARPASLVWGQETALQADERFGRAVASTLAAYPRQNLAIVTHGTVMALYLAPLLGVDAFKFWQGLSLPDFVALARPEVEPAG